MRLAPRWPSPSMVLAMVALFVALGGTGYATTSMVAHTAAKPNHARPATPLTKGQIEKLISSYLKSHKSQLGAKNGSNGSNGTNGTNGANGPSGTNGTNGSAVVDRARFDGSIAAPGGNTPTQVPLTTPNWTQAPLEFDQLYGVATVTAPAGCVTSGLLLVFALDNGNLAAQGTLSVSPNATSTNTYPIDFQPAGIFEPGVATANSFEAEFMDNCSSSHMTLKSVKLDAIAAQ